jgi:hypothetical protein
VSPFINQGNTMNNDDCYDPKTEHVRQHLRTREGSDEFNVREYWRRPRGHHRLY